MPVCNRSVLLALTLPRHPGIGGRSMNGLGFIFGALAALVTLAPACAGPHIAKGGARAGGQTAPPYEMAFASFAPLNT